LEKTSETTFSGTAENVIGLATGEVAGNAFNWTYKFRLKVGDSYWNVKFDDWMFLQEDGVLINKARVYRWGFHIGTVILSFSKAADKAAHTLNGLKANGNGLSQDLASQLEVEPVRKNFQ